MCGRWCHEGYSSGENIVPQPEGPYGEVPPPWWLGYKQSPGWVWSVLMDLAFLSRNGVLFPQSPGLSLPELYNLCRNLWRAVGVDQGWAVIWLEGPRWVVDLDERVHQVAQEFNFPHEDHRLTKNPAWLIIDWEIFRRASKIGPPWMMKLQMMFNLFGFLLS